LKTITCKHCKEVVLKNPRCPGQAYCGKPDCRKARRREWQRKKIKSDPDYRANQRQSQKQWQEKNKGYWKQYRRQKPDKAERNRILQKVRNRGLTPENTRQLKMILPEKIAKMDSLKNRAYTLSGMFWLVPKIAKMDSLMVFITDIKGEKTLPSKNEGIAKKDSIGFENSG